MKKVLSNKDLTLTIFTAMNNRDLSDLEQYISVNAVFDFPGADCMRGVRSFFFFLESCFGNIHAWK